MVMHENIEDTDIGQDFATRCAVCGADLESSIPECDGVRCCSSRCVAHLQVRIVSLRASELTEA
jgi:hypothetical protein